MILKLFRRLLGYLGLLLQLLVQFLDYIILIVIE